jgi:voltage-gated potassium channel
MATHNSKTPQAGLIKGTSLLIILLIVGTIGFSIIQEWGLLDSFYMTVITVSTVGYGEVHPLNNHGRVFASFLILLWLGTAFYTTTRLGQWVLEGKLQDVFERRKLMKDISKMKEHIVVCGMGRIGTIVAEGLQQENHQFCVVESERDREEELHQTGYRYILGDATEEDTLEEAGVSRARLLLALLPTDADNLYVTIAAKEINPQITVIARAIEERAEVRLKRAGANKVVSPYKAAGLRVLNAAIHPTAVEFMELVTHRTQLALGLEEVQVSDRSQIKDQTISQCGIRNRFGVIVVAIKRKSGEMVYNPEANETILAGDVLVIIGKRPDLERFQADCTLTA